MGTPWPSLGRGAGETTAGLVRPPPVILEKVWPQNKRGKEKQNKSNTRRPLPPRVPRKGLRRSKENPKNARGPEWHPGKTPRSGTHGQNGRKRQKRRDTKRKKTRKTGACAGVSCYYLNIVSKKKPTSAKNLRKRERTQKKPDLTSIEFFQTVSGAKRQKIKQKQ